MNHADERIVIIATGTPLISTRVWLNYNQLETTYRTLDGEPTTLQKGVQGELHASHLLAPVEQPKAGNGPLTWNYRIAGISDLNQPPVGWFLIRDDRPSGHDYFVGYDLTSKRTIGYLGRNGYGASLPPQEERFEHNHQSFGWMQGDICTTGQLHHGSNIPRYAYQSADFDQNFPKWLIFLIDGDRLQEVDLRTRKVRTLFQSPNLLGVSLLMTKKAVKEENDKDNIVRRLMLRLTDRIVLMDRNADDKQEYLLPESMQKLALSAYSLDNGQLLLVSQNYGAVTNGRQQSELIWFSADGQTVQHKEVSLAWPSRATSTQAQTAIAGLVAPIPLGWMVGGGIVGPLVMIQENKVSNYSAGLRKGITEGWPGLIISTLLALASAGFTLKLHHRYHRPHPGLWCLFVFFLGPAGLLAYWLGHHRVVLEPCSACGRTVPRDRDGCAACGETFAAPELVGTEIFASCVSH
ncbi:MAG: hypothetical protein ABGX16_26140 [Pirellulales bacterium]